MDLGYFHTDRRHVIIFRVESYNSSGQSPYVYTQMGAGWVYYSRTSGTFWSAQSRSAFICEVSHDVMHDYNTDTIPYFGTSPPSTPGWRYCSLFTTGGFHAVDSIAWREFRLIRAADRVLAERLLVVESFLSLRLKTKQKIIFFSNQIGVKVLE